jgi:hypothetical protein
MDRPLPNSHLPATRTNDFSRIIAQNGFDNRAQNSKVAPASDGVVAQLVEHHNGIVGVRSSNLLGSPILQPLRQAGSPSPIDC